MKKILLSFALLGLAACTTTVTPRGIDNDKVFFAFDSAQISPEAHRNLQDQALYMKLNPEIDVMIEGHCDERGSTEYNLALGALRAGNAEHVLIREGIEPERIRTISYGKEHPQYLGTGELVWAKNRNATTRVVEFK